MGGNLQASRAAGSDNMSLIGVLETESGKFTSFNQSFNVTSGTIDFNNPIRVNPDLNITTQKRLKDKIFELIISGNLETIRQNIIVKDENTAIKSLTLLKKSKSGVAIIAMPPLFKTRYTSLKNKLGSLICSIT